MTEQTRDEKIAMYMKLKKRELAEMLANRDAGWPRDSLPIGYRPDFDAGAWWG